MPAVTRIGDADVTHCSGMTRAQGSSDVKANGKGISREGDLNTEHLLPGSPCPGHAIGIQSGDPTVFANGKRIGRVGDPTCTQVAEGSPNVFSGGGAPGENIPVGGVIFTYQLVSSVGNTCNEGDVATITLTTQNLPNGTNVPYTVTGITIADLVVAESSPLTGNFVVGSQNTKAFKFATDQVTEGTENFKITITTQTPFLGDDNLSIAVADTSQNPVFTLSSSTSLTPQENTVGNFRLTVLNGIIGDSYPFTISAGQGNFDELDLEYIANYLGTQTPINQIPFTGTLTLRDLGGGIIGDEFDFKISDDFSRVEGSEVMTVSVLDAGILQTSLNFTIADSSLKTESAFVYSKNVMPAGTYGFEDVSLSNNQRANDPTYPQGYTSSNLATYPYAYAGTYGDTPMGGTITAAFGLNQAFQLNGINLVYVDGMGYVYGFISEEINSLVGANDSADLNYNHERQMIQNQLNTDTPNLTNSMASNAHQFSTYNYNLVATAAFQNTNKPAGRTSGTGISQVAFPHDYSTPPATDHSYQAATGPYHLYGAYTTTPAVDGDENFSTYGNKQHDNGQPYTSNCGSIWHLWFFRAKLSNGNPDLRPAQTKDFTYFGWRPRVYSAFTGINTAFFDHDVNWGNLWGTNDIGPDGISANSDGGVDLQTDSRVTFDTGVSQTLGGYVHIKIDCGTSRSQLIPGNAGMARLKDGNYYEQYDTFTEETRYRIDEEIPWWLGGGRLQIGPYTVRVKTGTAYRINDGSESYASQLIFTAEIELIFKMFAPATNTFASNSQGTNLWATTLPGGVSD